MSRAGKAFELGAVVVPIIAALDLQQQIETIGGSASLRLGQGALIKQTAWRRVRITLSGSGWCPLGLGNLDWEAQHVLKCGLPDSITTATPSIALPAARRTDAGYLPFARAHTPGGWRDTSVAIAGDVATITPVPGAQMYQVWYYPQITCMVEPPPRDFDRGANRAAWELVCEEV